MADDRCAMCREAGFPDVLAHYKPVPAGMSHNGKAVPPLCWDHKHGKVPRFITEVKGNSLEALVEQTHREIAGKANAAVSANGRVCACGCGTSMGDYVERLKFIRGHKPKKTALAKTERPIHVPRGRKPKNLSLIDVLQNLRGLIDAQKAEIDKNLGAVDTVIELVRRADESESAADFMRR
jgi:hypothetical protein